MPAVRALASLTDERVGSKSLPTAFNGETGTAWPAAPLFTARLGNLGAPCGYGLAKSATYRNKERFYFEFERRCLSILRKCVVV